MKKIISSLVVVSIILISFIAFADSIDTIDMIGKQVQGSLPLIINGQRCDKDVIVIDDTGYLPVRKAGEIFGYEVDFMNNKVILSNQNELILEEITIEDVTVRINKVIQDSDSLRLYVEYINNTDDAILTADILAKIISNDKQYAYEIDFNWDRFYNKNIREPQNLKLSTFIEPKANLKSVIYFAPIKDIDFIDIELKANFKTFEFNNIKAEKQKDN